MAMGPLTWKNVQPTGSGAILGAINDSAKLIGTGIAGVGDAFTNYADQRSTRETDALEAALLAAGEDEQARQAVMQGQDMSFIDQARLNTIEQGRQDKVLKEALWQSHLKDETDATIKINAAKPKDKTFIVNGAGQFAKDYKANTGENLSPGFVSELSTFESDLRAAYPNLTDKQIRNFMSKNVSLRQDYLSPNNFTFNHKGKTYDFGGADWLSTDGKLKAANAIITQSTADQAVKADAYKQFSPTGDKSYNEFEAIWAKYYNNHDSSTGPLSSTDFLKSINTK